LTVCPKTAIKRIRFGCGLLWGNNLGSGLIRRNLGKWQCGWGFFNL
jgi:hypothetical protein